MLGAVKLCPVVSPKKIECSALRIVLDYQRGVSQNLKRILLLNLHLFWGDRQYLDRLIKAGLPLAKLPWKIKSKGRRAGSSGEMTFKHQARMPTASFLRRVSKSLLTIERSSSQTPFASSSANPSNSNPLCFGAQNNVGGRAHIIMNAFTASRRSGLNASSHFHVLQLKQDRNLTATLISIRLTA